jgi:phosphoglycerate dehydrogenase-like enzyme
MMRPKAAFFCNNPATIERVYAQGRKEQVAALTELYPVVVTHRNLDEHVVNLTDLEVIFSTWGMPALTVAQLANLPQLKAVFYGAGSVKGFATPFLECGVTVCSAWAANAVSVAEFCLAQILLATKGYFRNTAECRDPEKRHAGKCFQGKGCYGETVALIGAGQIGRKVIALLKPFKLRILVVDPYLSDKDAEALGVETVSLETAFREAYVVSNHLPNLPDLKQVLNGKLFASMRSDATFINTGRGAQVNEPELIAVLQERPDLQALLDVTYPEPPVKDSPFYVLPNVKLTSHLAGAHDDEVVRMADYMIEEFKHFQAGEPLQYAVDLEMLKRMA